MNHRDVKVLHDHELGISQINYLAMFVVGTEKEVWFKGCAEHHSHVNAAQWIIINNHGGAASSSFLRRSIAAVWPPLGGG